MEKDGKFHNRSNIDPWFPEPRVDLDAVAKGWLNFAAMNCIDCIDLETSCQWIDLRDLQEIFIFTGNIYAFL